MKLKIKNKARFSLAVTTMVALMYLIVSALAMAVETTVANGDVEIVKAKSFPLVKHKTIITPAAIITGSIEPITTQSAIEKKELHIVDIRGLLPWYSNLERNCKKRDIDPRLMVAIYSIESEFNPRGVNPSSGARGLGQITYDSYRIVNKKLKDGVTWAQMKEPWANIRYTTVLFEMKVNEYKTLRKAIHSYGGCRSAFNKYDYENKINTKLKLIYGITLADIS